LECVAALLQRVAEALIGGKLFRAGDQLSAALRCVVMYRGIVAACARTNIFDKWKVLAFQCCSFKLGNIWSFLCSNFSLKIHGFGSKHCTIFVRMQKTNKFFLSYLLGYTWCVMSRTPCRGVVDTYVLCWVGGVYQIVCMSAVYL
jgi:hypothetical protein